MDILLAQELCDPAIYLAQARRTWRDLGYREPLWQPVGSHRKWGSAIFVKDGTLRDIPTPAHLAGWVVGAEITALPDASIDSRALTVFSVHTPTRESNYYIWQAQEVLEYLATRCAPTLVIGGDFNVIISDPGAASTADDSTLQQGIRTYMRRTLGLVNCWQTINPNTALPTTWHGRPQAQSHIDGLFISPDLFDDLATCWIVGAEREAWDEGDHYPVVATFDATRPEFPRRVLRRVPAPLP